MAKTKGELLQEQLCNTTKHAGLLMDEEEKKAASVFAEKYKTFLNSAKTEREAVKSTIAMLQKEGYKEFDPATKYKAGDKIYQNNRGKALIFAVIGKKPLQQGVHIIASHIDSPRVDLKANPLYEDNELALAKTHYYGGIRKYQWVTIPLALHGVVSLKDGSIVDINIGENADDPIFFMTDLLPHLSQGQNQRKLHEGIKGEELNVLFGSMPFEDEKISERVKLNVLQLLYTQYGITEADFQSADLSLVPAYQARDIGLDRSMIGAYGQDDKVCAYTSIAASLEVQKPEITWVNILADKEETGSDGNTGLNSRMLEYFIADLAAPYGVAPHTVLQHSKCLSADVTVAIDPTFPDVTEARNSGRFGYGVALCKYTGARGKSGTSEASAEYMGWVRTLLEQAGVIWQTATLGKVDQGGGGTVAMFIAQLGVDVVDIGVPVLAMHAPMEVVNKLDVYQTYKAFVAFLKAK